MLVLTRNTGDKLMIGENIEVVVLGVSGGQVRIGISAPREIKVLRDNAIRREPIARRAELKLPAPV